MLMCWFWKLVIALVDALGRKSLWAVVWISGGRGLKEAGRIHCTICRENTATLRRLVTHITPSTVNGSMTLTMSNTRAMATNKTCSKSTTKQPIKLTVSCQSWEWVEWERPIPLQFHVHSHH
eukprot:Lithocolla_globosa_v1_NODE_4461_length_1430_cov_3.944727.p3 type:complete len:122 gc:universal NODE_4461_length_1430_cov_3.944727:1262-897(-)